MVDGEWDGPPDDPARCRIGSPARRHGRASLLWYDAGDHANDGAVWDRARHPHGVAQPFHVWRLFFLCKITGGDPKPGPETSEVAFFAEHELPAELSTRRVLLPQLKRMFEYMRRPDLPTEFD
jgi:hypothetical protein